MKEVSISEKKRLQEIEWLLRAVGVGRRLTGFHHAVHMIQRVMDDPDCLLLITKCLYPETACIYQVSAATVERTLRTLVKVAWQKGGQESLSRIAGRDLENPPTNSEFLDMMAAYLQREA